MVTEIFKGTKNDKGLRDALAKRKVNVERAKAREIRNIEGSELHRQRGSSLGGTTSNDRRSMSYGEMTNSSHGECSEIEEDQIRDMAVRAIQARWRMIRYITSVYARFYYIFVMDSHIMFIISNNDEK